MIIVILTVLVFLLYLKLCIHFSCLQNNAKCARIFLLFEDMHTHFVSFEKNIVPNVLVILSEDISLFRTVQLN